jgi:Fe-S-cluster containining protein
VSRGQYGFVYLTRADRRRLAGHLGLTVRDLVQRWCVREDGRVRLRDAPDQASCIFLEDTRCGVYPGRPTQCRTWPFWPSVMNPKAWAREVASFCPGIGKGEPVPPEEIAEKLRLQEQADSELE